MRCDNFIIVINASSAPPPTWRVTNISAITYKSRVHYQIRMKTFLRKSRSIDAYQHFLAVPCDRIENKGKTITKNNLFSKIDRVPLHFALSPRKEHFVSHSGNCVFSGRIFSPPHIRYSLSQSICPHFKARFPR